MARKLRTFQTSQGFFDLAIAAPSMKAALEAWGANSNLFHQGFASEVDDPKVVAATLAKPGVVLRRPVGTKGPFTEHAELPTDLGLEKPLASPTKPKAKKAGAHPARKRDDKAARAAALAYEKEQHKREAEKRRQEAVAAKKREKLERAVEKAQAAYDKAEREHEARIDALMAERTDLEAREKAEDTRWRDQRERLRDAVRKAGG